MMAPKQTEAPRPAPTGLVPFLQHVIERFHLKNQTGLAKFLGIPQPTVGRWMDPENTATPSLSNIETMADRLGMTMVDVLAAIGAIPEDSVQQRVWAPELVAIQRFLDESATTAAARDFLLQGAQGLLNMCVELRDGVRTEPQRRRRG